MRFSLAPLTPEAFERHRTALQELLGDIAIEAERRRPETAFAPEVRDPNLSFLAEEPESGALLGFVTAHRPLFVPATAFVPWLAVVGRARRRGIGRALLGAALSAAAEAGCRRLILYVQAGDDRARAFYERLGGRPAQWMPALDVAGGRRGAQWQYVWDLTGG